MQQTRFNKNHLKVMLRFSLFMGFCITVGWFASGKTQATLMDDIRRISFTFGIIFSICFTFSGTAALIHTWYTNYDLKKVPFVPVPRPLPVKLKTIMVEYTLADYMIANKLHYRRQFSYWLSRSVCWVGLALFIYFIVWLPSLMLSWVMAAFFLFLSIYVPLSWRLKGKSLFNQQRNLHEERKMRFAEGQIVSKSKTEQDTYRYLRKVEFSDKMILAYNTEVTFVMLPKRVFVNDAQFSYWLQECQKLTTVA